MMKLEANEVLADDATRGAMVRYYAIATHPFADRRTVAQLQDQLAAALLADAYERDLVAVAGGFATSVGLVCRWNRHMVEVVPRPTRKGR